MTDRAAHADHGTGAVFLVMGVSASGKSTLGRMLAADLGARFLDADDFHPPENVAKMKAGVPLADADRAGWLEQLNAVLRDGVSSGESLVLACSALKKRYRAQLREGIRVFQIVFLDGSRSILEERLDDRPGHFMPGSLLDSQLATLEAPSGEEVIRVDFEWPLDQAIGEIRAQLEERARKA